MNKRYILLISPCLIIQILITYSLTGCDDSPYKKYTLQHNAVHFSFEYPSYYKKQNEYVRSSERAPIGIRFVYWPPESSSKIVFGLNISGVSSIPKTVESAITGTISGIGGMDQVTERSPVVIAGITGELLVFLDYRMTKNPCERAAFFSSNGLVWELYIYSSEEQQEQAKADFDYILQSFKMLE